MSDGSQISWLPPGTPQQPVPPQRTGPRRLLAPLLVALGVVVKYGKVALLFAGKAKVLTTAGSMLVSVAAYALIWGWRFAVGFVLLLLVHEMGHVFQLRREGVEASAPLFIPFLGAVVGAKSLGGDAAAEARVGLAGPVLGTAGAIAVLGAADATGSELLRALAFTGFFLNLFNLIPLTPLDGGRAMAAMSPWMWFVGLAMAVAFAVTFPNPIIILIVLVGGIDSWSRWKRYRDGGAEGRAYYRVDPRTRLLVGAVYLGLIAVCVLGMDLSHLQRTFSDV
jgi:Zn-dependent protease